MSDTELLNLPSFEASALPVLPDLHRLARALTRDRTRAEDLVQDVCLAALRKWHTYDPSLSCRNWLFAICRHRFYRTSAREQRSVAVEEGQLELLGLAQPALTRPPDALTGAERSDMHVAVRHAMAALPAPFRDVAILVDWHDLTYETTATTLDIPVGTVRSRLCRARRILRHRLAAYAQDAGLLDSQAAGRGKNGQA